MTYRIVQETIAGKQPQLLPLLAAHREELATDKELMAFAPDFERYIAAEASGMLFALFAYCGEQLVGYSCNLTMQHMHYPMRYGHNDLLFITKEHRGSRLGLQLINATKDACRERGAKFMVWHAKPDTALAQILPRLGCKVQDILFSELL